MDVYIPWEMFLTELQFGSYLLPMNYAIKYTSFEIWAHAFQHLLSEMESLKPKVQAVQLCQSALRIPEDVVTNLPLCHAALHLQEEASRLQHSAIQQCNIMQASGNPLNSPPPRIYRAP